MTPRSWAKLIALFAVQWGGAWLLWLWRHPLGCPDFTEAIAMDCGSNASVVYISYMIIVDGSLLLVLVAWYNFRKRRSGRE